MYRRYILTRAPVALAALLFGGGRMAFAHDDAEAAEFMRDLMRRASAALTGSNLTEQERQENFRQILNQAMDMELIAGLVLGPYRRRVSEQQLATFRRLFEENIVQNYAWRFRDYNSSRFSIIGFRDTGRESLIVETEVITGEAQTPVRVGWRVRKTNDQFRIIDILVENISMMVTQRDDYVAVLRANGGDMDYLMDALRRQNEKLANR